GQRLDVYRVLRKIGEGGMGEVYEVEQEEPIRRRLALKLLRPGRQRDVARFLAERQMMASMAHRHVARVYGAGAVGGRPYLALELLDAPPITDYCDRLGLGVEARLRLFIDVCHGVQHAHRRGIIHRDLKPSNILVATEDGEPVAKVIDFGISKALDGEATGHTENGQWLGTPDYMSPEQAVGGSGLDTRSDVYSLGVVLYELLTGRRPFNTAELRGRGLGVMLQVLQEEPPPAASQQWRGDGHGERAALRGSTPPELERRLRGELDWVLRRALEKEVDRRYDSPLALARDLRRHLDDRPLEAAKPSPLYLLRKFYRRRRLAVVSAALVSVSLLAGLAGTGLGLVRAQEAQREASARAEEARAEAERANREADTARRITDFMWGVFRASDPGSVDRPDEATLGAVLERGAERVQKIEQDPFVKARLLNAIGQTYVSLGRTAEGRGLIEQATPLLEGLPEATAD
ncbi:MAG: serine/threonine-protein kinase, partial [Acidobacteriota bacterium]